MRTACTGSIKLQCGIVPGAFITPFLFWISLIPHAANNSDNSNTGYKHCWKKLGVTCLLHMISLQEGNNLKFSCWQSKNHSLYPRGTAGSFTQQKKNKEVLQCCLLLSLLYRAQTWFRNGIDSNVNWKGKFQEWPWRTWFEMPKLDEWPTWETWLHGWRCSSGDKKGT